MMLFIFILAVWRLTYLLTEEDAPFDLAHKFRMKTFNVDWLDTSCFDCMSIWVSLPFSFFYFALTNSDISFIGFFVILLALSAGSIVINRLLERLNI